MRVCACVCHICVFGKYANEPVCCHYCLPLLLLLLLLPLLLLSCVDYCCYRCRCWCRCFRSCYCRHRQRQASKHLIMIRNRYNLSDANQRNGCAQLVGAGAGVCGGPLPPHPQLLTLQKKGKRNCWPKSTTTLLPFGFYEALLLLLLLLLSHSSSSAHLEFAASAHIACCERRTF